MKEERTNKDKRYVIRVLGSVYNDGEATDYWANVFERPVYVSYFTKPEPWQRFGRPFYTLEKEKACSYKEYDCAERVADMVRSGRLVITEEK